MKTLRYFYHPDHLGSSSVSTPLNNHWITYGSGNAIQHLHYLLLKSFAFFPPWRSVKKIYFLYTHCLRRFGEDWVDQRNASWNAPYTFSGKEKDVETWYSYFGARYYDSGLSIWLSVDPMSDKYPNLTPYAYCANNPVILVDPDGRDWYEAENGKITWTNYTSQKGRWDAQRRIMLGNGWLWGTDLIEESLRRDYSVKEAHAHFSRSIAGGCPFQCDGLGPEGEAHPVGRIS
jgi:RHS repeat-associated protein